jgi:hypothetical protein
MRDHGVDFPDPQRVGSGGIKITGRNINPNDPKTKSAQSACQKYMQIGGGESIDPARRAKLQESALKYARCMREHGVDMPDPQFENGGANVTIGGPDGPDIDPNSQAFKDAEKACESLLPGKLGSSGDAGPVTQGAKP